MQSKWAIGNSNDYKDPAIRLITEDAVIVDWLAILRPNDVLQHSKNKIVTGVEDFLRHLIISGEAQPPDLYAVSLHFLVNLS